MIAKSIRVIFFVAIVASILIACEHDPANKENNPPYAVNGPATKDIDGGSPDPQYVELSTNAPGSELDPDGDSVTFKGGFFPDYATLDGSTGVITVQDPPYPPPEGIDVELTVWTEDEHGLSSAEFIVTLRIRVS